MPKILIYQFEFFQKMKNENDEEVENMEDLPELASLSNRFNYFETFNDQEQKDSRKKSKDESHETESARRDCKASSVLNKFKEMENKVLNGEDDGKFRTEFVEIFCKLLYYLIITIILA